MTDEEGSDATQNAKVPTKVKVVGGLVALAFLASIFGDQSPRASAERPSPDGSGWYKDSGLTNAQVIEITEYCRDNPDSFRCQ